MQQEVVMRRVGGARRAWRGAAGRASISDGSSGNESAWGKAHEQDRLSIVVTELLRFTLDTDPPTRGAAHLLLRRLVEQADLGRDDEHLVRAVLAL
jgi:hypothetical protein